MLLQIHLYHPGQLRGLLLAQPVLSTELLSLQKRVVCGAIDHELLGLVFSDFNVKFEDHWAVGLLASRTLSLFCNRLIKRFTSGDRLWFLLQLFAR